DIPPVMPRYFHPPTFVGRPAEILHLEFATRESFVSWPGEKRWTVAGGPGSSPGLCRWWRRSGAQCLPKRNAYDKRGHDTVMLWELACPYAARTVERNRSISCFSRALSP